MSVLFLDSFDDGLQSLKGYIGSNPAISLTYGRNGYGAQVGDNSNKDLTKTFPNSTTIIVGFAFLQKIAPNDNDTIMILGDGGTGNLWLRWKATGALELQNSGGLLASTPIGLITIGVWYYLEIKTKVDNATGTTELRVNGKVQAIATGVDTQGGANAYNNQIQIGGAGTGWTHDSYIDDFIILDDNGVAPHNNFLGDVRIQSLFPRGNGASSVLVGSDLDSIDNYLLVDENPTPVTTDYVGSSLQGDLDTYLMDALPSTAYDVLGIQTVIYSAKDDAGLKFMRPVIRTGAIDYVGTSKALGLSYAPQLDIWELNPNTGVAWTATEINALEVGQEVRDT